MRKKHTQEKKRPDNNLLFAILLTVCSLLVFGIFLYKFGLPILPTHASAQITWPMFDYDSQKSGENTNESYITPQTVAGLKQIWQTSIPNSDGSPVYLAGVTTSQGVKNLVFVTTQTGSLIALDDATGTIVWQENTTGAGSNITSSPVIDPTLQYVYSYGKDGKVHRYAVGTGAEDTTNGWPLTVSLLPNVEKGSSSLTIGNGYLYMTVSGYPGDAGDYDGHIVGKNLTTGQVSVFNTLCAQTKALLTGNCPQYQSGVWARPGAVVDPATGNVFIVTGNGLYQPPDYLGDSVIELSPDLATVIDTYTTTNYAVLDNADEDLGSTAPAMVPTQTGGDPSEIAVQGGKDDKLRVLNRQNLSGQGAPYKTGGELQTLATNCNILSQPISFTDANENTWVAATDTCDNLYMYKVVNSRLTQAYVKANMGGSSPILVNGMLFIQASGSIKAIDPATGNVLWTAAVGSRHWQNPIVINGHVFVLTNDGKITAFDLANEAAISSGIAPSGTSNQFFGITPTIITSPSPTPPTVTPTYYILQLGPTSQP